MLAAAVLLITCFSAFADASRPPLPVDQSRSATARRHAKPVLASQVLDDMESENNWSHFGPGEMSFTKERARNGKQSIRSVSPTKLNRTPPVQGRPFGESGVRRNAGGADWSDFNRVSFWVYPNLPGFNVVSLLVKLNSEGTRGQSYTDGAMHFVLVTNGVWNHVAWEIEHLERKQVTSLDLIYRLQGNEPGATNTVCFDFDDLRLERVQPDYFRGWEVAPGELAYCHLGYAPNAAKVCLAPANAAGEFTIVSADTGKVVFTGKAERITNSLGAFRQCDFTAFQRPGEYLLRVGKLESAAFPIGTEHWNESLTAALNFFYAQRCGDVVPGIHGVCHQDWQARRGEKRIVINGGWHDAGDLSQGLVNTSEGVWSMLRLAQAVEKIDAGFAAKLRNEAAWGLQWMLKTRFDDGSRVTWATMDFWTDGQTGNVDDVVVDARDNPFENWVAATAEAAAARHLSRTHPDLAAKALAAAKADWKFASDRAREPGVELAAAGVQASLELFHVTKDEMYAAKARELAEVLISSQQVEAPGWDVPIRGFFYTSPRKDRFLHYNHRSHEQAPVIALADLCEALPGVEARPRWLNAVRLYGEYLLAGARQLEPWQMTAAGLYRASTSNAREREQVHLGIKLDDDIYLRRFPVWSDFRGNLGVQLSQALAAARAARLLNDPKLRSLAESQLEWTLGRNPFAQSLMYGVGHGYAPQYTAMSGDITGSLPVGIQTRRAEDIPYWPAANCYNYAEVWVHPVSRWFATIAELGL